MPGHMDVQLVKAGWGDPWVLPVRSCSASCQERPLGGVPCRQHTLPFHTRRTLPCWCRRGFGLRQSPFLKGLSVQDLCRVHFHPLAFHKSLLMESLDSLVHVFPTHSSQELNGFHNHRCEFGISTWNWNQRRLQGGLERNQRVLSNSKETPPCATSKVTKKPQECSSFQRNVVEGDLMMSMEWGVLRFQH